MTTDQEMERIVRSWLEPGLTRLTDDVLDQVLDQLPATPQRRPSLARRIADMNPLAKYAVAAAAVVVIAIVSLSVLAQGSTRDTVGVAPSLSPSPSASSLLSSPASTTPLIRSGALEPGTYRSFMSGGVTLTVPDGWTGGADEFIAYKGGDAFDDTTSATLVVWRVTHVYANACAWSGTLVETGTPSALAGALAAQQGHDTVGPVETTLGGYPATRLEFSVPAEFDITQCDEDFIRLWPDAGPNEDAGLPIAPGQTTTVYVVDVNGSPRLVGAIRWEDTSAADVTELEAVVDSLQFGP